MVNGDSLSQGNTCRRRANRLRLIWSASLLIIILAGFFIPHDTLPPTCGMKSLFGVGCPTCGMTRAFHALLHADFSASFAYHPLLVPMLLVAIPLFAAAIISPLKAGQWLARNSLKLLLGWLGVALLVWGVRLRLGIVP